MYIGSLNKDWRRFVEAIGKLYEVIRSDEYRIEDVIKSLHKRFSEAIMYFMKSGSLEITKVSYIFY